MNRCGNVFINNEFAGVIEQNDGPYIFTYDPEYLNRQGSLPVSLTLPLRSNPYVQNTMFSFFDGLIPEGWLLNIIEGNWKINPRDRMGLLLLACRDCVGNVSIIDNSPKNLK